MTEPVYNPDDEDLPLRPTDNILLRRDSRCIIMDAFELGREFPEVEIDPRLVFDNPTIESLSQAIVDLPKTQRTKSVESASTAQPGVTLTSVAFTQITGTGEMAPCSYRPRGGEASRYYRSTDGMESILLPASMARIGDDTNCPTARENEGPSHVVELSSFLMDIEPVSLGAYARFLNLTQPSQDELFDFCLLPAEDARCCHIPLTLGEEGWQVKPGVPPNWPMILVSWYGANAYALWAHGEDWRSYKTASKSFLPTEAQWEYAARGPETMQFPWGNDDATPDLLNVCWDASTYDSKGNVTAHVATPLEELPLVGVNVLMGVSPFGLRGMAGNVWQCRPRQLRMQVDSIDESQVYVWNACFCCYDGCVPGCHIGCAEQKTILCLECDCCCKTKTPALRCICCDLRCVDVSVCCKQQDQNCCCVSAWAIPPDHSVRLHMEGQRPNEIIAKQIRPTAAAYANLSAELLAAELAVPSLLHLEMPMPEEPQWSLTLHLEDPAVKRPKAAQRGLWPRGSYWILDHLGKLQLAALPEGFSNRYLSSTEVAQGGELNESLSEGSRFRTLVHGDAKPENILCNASSGHVECAALDFGWVGEGYGACDVAYLLWDQIASNKKRRLDALLPVFEELEDLAHRGRQLCQRRRLRLAAPANFPLDARTGLPAAHHLPKGFTLPWPSLEEEMPKAMALASGLKRVPPPQALLERSSGVPGAAWAVQLRPIAPASAVLFTVDGSLPRVGSASTMRASEAPVLLAEGGQVFAVAAAPGKHLSDVVTVKTPMAKDQREPPAAPVGVATKKVQKRRSSSFRSNLLLAESDED
eukprot:g9957.t1